MDDRGDERSQEADWRSLYRIGAWSAVGMLALIPVQMFFYLRYPPPSTPAAYFELFQRNWLLGLASLDLFYLVDILLAGLLVLSICLALRRVNPAIVAVALFLQTIATIAYIPSNTGFEMLNLSARYAAAATQAERVGILGAGEGMLAIYKGTAFNAGYVLSAVAGLLLAGTMFQTRRFGRTVPYLGVAANALGLVPSTAGKAGLVASLVFLVPFLGWLPLVAGRLFRLGSAPVSDRQR